MLERITFNSASSESVVMVSSLSVEVPFRGGCACGDIRYECSDGPVAMFNCHCKDCQRVSGGTFSTVALIKENSLKLIRGKPKYHRSIGAVGRWTDRGFCVECGTHLFAKGEVAPGYLTIKPGSLDDASWFRPTIDSWTSCVQEWLILDPKLQKAHKNPNVLRKTT